MVSSTTRSSCRAKRGSLAGHGAMVAALVTVAVAVSPARAQSPNRCKGAKVFHAGKCRYPDEVKQLEAQQKAAVARRARDRKRCQAAEQTGSLQGWRDYLRAHPNGACRKQAQDQIARLEADQPQPPPSGNVPGPPSPAVTTQPSSTVTTPPAPPDAAGAGPSPLVFVGFGIGGAGLLTWVVTGSIAWSQSASLEEACSGSLCPQDRQGDLDTATTLAHVATVGLAVGAAGSALGLIALLALGDDSSGDNSSELAATATPSLRPLIGDGIIGLRGRF